MQSQVLWFRGNFLGTILGFVLGIFLGKVFFSDIKYKAPNSSVIKKETFKIPGDSSEACYRLQPYAIVGPITASFRGQHEDVKDLIKS